MVEQAAHIRWVRGSSPFAAIFLCNKKGCLEKYSQTAFFLAGAGLEPATSGL